MSSTEQQQQPATKKQRLIQVTVEDDDTKTSLMLKLDDAAEKEMQYMDAKKTFLHKIGPHKESFIKLNQGHVDRLMYLMTRSSNSPMILADKAKSTHRDITVELNKYDKETQEYILETTDVYQPLQFFDGKKACLRELLKEVAERVEKLEEKDL